MKGKVIERVVIYSYAGLGNIGDDLMTMAMVLNKSVRYISQKKEYSLPGISYVDGFSYFVSIMFSEKFLVSGGNVFSYERFWSLIKVLSLITLVKIRTLSGKKNSIDSAGLNLKSSQFWRLLQLIFCKNCDLCCFRDVLSFRYMRRFCKKAGCVISYAPDRVYRERDWVNRLAGSEQLCSSPIWFISASALAKSGKNNLAQDIRIANLLSRESRVIFFCQEQSDVERAESLSKLFAPNVALICSYRYTDIDVALSKIKNAKLIITERYHGAVLAECFAKEWRTLPYTEKLSRISPNNYMIKHFD